MSATVFSSSSSARLDYDEDDPLNEAFFFFFLLVNLITVETDAVILRESLISASPFEVWICWKAN